MLSTVKSILVDNNYVFVEKPINFGTQLVCTNGVKINIYNTNKVNVQGNAKLVENINHILGLSPRS